MLINAIMAYLHHLAAFTITAALVYEWITFRKDITLAEARRLQRVDIAYGISAGVVLIVGTLRVIYFEKGAAYYTANHFFWEKMTLFVIVALLSIYPTIRFVAWNKYLAQGQAPVVTDQEEKRIKILLNLELIGIALILLMAPLMARGLGV